MRPGLVEFSGVAIDVSAEPHDPLEVVPDSRPSGSAGRRPRLIIVGVSAFALAVVLWLGRAPIAQLIVDHELAARAIPARFTLKDIGFNRQRLTNIVVGDPAHPDLVADWVELDTRFGWGSAELSGVRAGRVRLRGRVKNGALSLGSIDKLLPKTAGKPFSLPDLFFAVADGRMRLEAEQGVVGLRLSGSGRLNNGFRGNLAAISEGLYQAGCQTGRSAAVLTLAIDRGAPTLHGPVRTASLACGPVSSGPVSIAGTVTLGAALNRWHGMVDVTARQVRHPQALAARAGGRISFAGGFGGARASTAGRLELHAAGLAMAALSAGRARLDGDYVVQGASVRFDGAAGVVGAALAPAWRARVASLAEAAPNTPVAPLLARLAADVQTAARRFDGNALVSFASGRALTLRSAAITSASGARFAMLGGRGLRYRLADGALGLDAALSMGGGGLPVARLALAQARPGGVVSGRGYVAPYAASGARLAIGAIAFSRTAHGAVRMQAHPVVSGPLAGGSVFGAQMPIEVEWNGHTSPHSLQLALNSACAPLAFARLAVAGLVLERTQMRLCPVGGALVRFSGGRLSGGGAVTALRLGGTIGGTAMMFAADKAQMSLSDGAFRLANVATRLGSGSRVTRIEAATLAGRAEGPVLSGRFGGGGGQIGGVPLLMSAAGGDWRFSDGKLAVGGAMTLADADPAARFNPLRAPAVALRLADNIIEMKGAFENPATGVMVGRAALRHDLRTVRGHADLVVPGLAFDDRLQPDQLTPLTYGVIAAVKGLVTGDGRIDWTADGVTSTGEFRTTGMDLAAAFGPVTGVSTHIRFTDLLNLESAPDQVATVAVLNPGIAVENGVVHYQTLAGQRLRVLSAHWPLAGGDLDLQPALLDFAQERPRALTFRITGMDAGQFLQQFDFKNLTATGTFDGLLPMIFDAKGGQIEQGRLEIRQGGGTIAYVGDLSQKDLGTWGNLAFQALKSLRYQRLGVVMNGPLAGEMVTEVNFAGVSQGKGTKSNFVIRRLQKLPLVFNVRIAAPFRSLIDSVQSFYDPRTLVRRELSRPENSAARALPAPAPPIQPPASEHLP